MRWPSDASETPLPSPSPAPSRAVVASSVRFDEHRAAPNAIPQTTRLQLTQRLRITCSVKKVTRRAGAGGRARRRVIHTTKSVGRERQALGGGACGTRSRSMSASSATTSVAGTGSSVGVVTGFGAAAHRRAGPAASRRPRCTRREPRRPSSSRSGDPRYPGGPDTCPADGCRPDSSPRSRPSRRGVPRSRMRPRTRSRPTPARGPGTRPPRPATGERTRTGESSGRACTIAPRRQGSRSAIRRAYRACGRCALFRIARLGSCYEDMTTRDWTRHLPSSVANVPMWVDPEGVARLILEGTR